VVQLAQVSLLSTPPQTEQRRPNGSKTSAPAQKSIRFVACCVLIPRFTIKIALYSTMFATVASSCFRVNVTTFAQRQSLGLQRKLYHGFRTMSLRSGGGKTQATSLLTGTAIAAIAFASLCTFVSTDLHQATQLEKSSIPSSGDVISCGTPVKEAATGILFPPLCTGYYLAGTGVRVKWGLIKVYAVGTYVDPLAMSAIKTNDTAIEQALLDPNYPRTIRIVMNRALSIDKYTSAIVEALKPRMNGEDLDTLEEFKALNPPVDLIQGTS
jgi:hypothetical protein